VGPETEKVSFVVTVVSVGPASVNLLACRLLWVCEEGRSNKAIRDRETGVGSYFFLLSLHDLRAVKFTAMFTQVTSVSELLLLSLLSPEVPVYRFYPTEMTVS
jgi:hypothetical protein